MTTYEALVVSLEFVETLAAASEIGAKKKVELQTGVGTQRSWDISTLGPTGVACSARNRRTRLGCTPAVDRTCKVLEATKEDEEGGQEKERTHRDEQLKKMRTNAKEYNVNGGH